MNSDVMTKPDVALEQTLRPSAFNDFTGQAKVKDRLEIAVEAGGLAAYASVIDNGTGDSVLLAPELVSSSSCSGPSSPSGGDFTSASS